MAAARLAVRLAVNPRGPTTNAGRTKEVQMFRKTITAGLAVAMLAVAVPASASADVPRCESAVTTNTTVTTATFTVLQPKDTVGQFENVWKHDYTVIVQPNGSFVGTGTITDNGG